MAPWLSVSCGYAVMVAVCPGHNSKSLEGSLVQVTSSWWRTDTKTALDLTVSQGTIRWSRSTELSNAVLTMTVNRALEKLNSTNQIDPLSLPKIHQILMYFHLLGNLSGD